MSEQILRDLRERLVQAAANLEALAGREGLTTGPEPDRLRAKAAGVTLALSYLDEALR